MWKQLQWAINGKRDLITKIRRAGMLITKTSVNIYELYVSVRLRWSETCTHSSSRKQTDGRETSLKMIDLNYWNLAGHCRKTVRCSCGSFNQLHQNITGKVYSKTTGVPLKKKLLNWYFCSSPTNFTRTKKLPHTCMLRGGRWVFHWVIFLKLNCRVPFVMARFSLILHIAIPRE